MKNKYLRTKHSVSLLNYHFVFCPRYRRKIFVDKEVEKRFRVMVQDACHELGVHMLGLECGDDYVHAFLKAEPKLSPQEIVARIKSVSSKQLKKEFAHLKDVQTIWTRSFFVSVADDVSQETIDEYVEDQKTRLL